MMRMLFYQSLEDALLEVSLARLTSLAPISGLDVCAA